MIDATACAGVNLEAPTAIGCAYRLRNAFLDQRVERAIDRHLIDALLRNRRDQFLCGGRSVIVEQRRQQRQP